MSARLVGVLTAFAIVAGAEALSAEKAAEVLSQVTPILDDMGANERARQQKIQDLACEYDGIAPIECPRIPAWIPMTEQIQAMTTSTSTTLLPAITIPPVLGL